MEPSFSGRISAINKFPPRKHDDNLFGDSVDWHTKYSTKSAEVYRKVERKAKRINNWFTHKNLVGVNYPWKYEVTPSQTPSGRPEVVVSKVIVSGGSAAVQYGLYRDTPQKALVFLEGILELTESLIGIGPVIISEEGEGS